MRTRNRRLIFMAVALVAAALPEFRVAARQGGSSPAAVELRAIGDNGDPVLDLKPADVTLRVGGKPREIRSLELIKVADAAPGGTAVAAGRIPPPFATNAAPAGGGTRTREVLIIVDEDSIAPGREQLIKDALRQLVGALKPTDRVGVLSTRQGGTNVQLTASHDDVRAGIAKFSGYAPTRESTSDFVCRTAVALQTIRSATAGFSPNASPTLVVVSAGLSAPREEVSLRSGASDLCQLRARDFEELGTAIQNRGVALYAVHAIEAHQSAAGSQALQAGLDSVAGSAGGETIRLTGSVEAALTRIARETAAYYVASFDAEPGERNGSRQRVEVRVGRERVRVIATPYIVLPAAGAAPATGGKPVTPRDMIRVATPFTDLPLRATTYTALNPDGKVRLMSLFEPLDPATRLAAATVVAYDEKGTVRAQFNAEGADLGRQPVMAALLVTPGTYRVRVAATDASGRAGAVDAPVRAELTAAGTLKLSALVLGTSQSGKFAAKMQYGPGDEQAIGYVEVYGVSPTDKLGVTFELAESEQGPAIATGPSQITKGPAEDVRLAYGGFGIGPMQPGDLIMRAVVTLDGKPVGYVSRTMRKVK